MALLKTGSPISHWPWARWQAAVEVCVHWCHFVCEILIECHEFVTIFLQGTTLVTPYEIHLEHAGNQACWYELSVDGRQVWNKPFPEYERSM